MKKVYKTKGANASTIGKFVMELACDKLSFTYDHKKGIVEVKDVTPQALERINGFLNGIENLFDEIKEL